jgi:hypothetical protein
VFERTCGPVAGDTGVMAGRLATGRARESFLRGWRLLAIDGFDVDVADTPANAEEFGYAGSGERRSAFCKARVVALSECGTHAFVAAEVDAYAVGETTLANRLYPRLNDNELLTADRNLCATRRFIAFPVQPGGIGGTFLDPMAYPDPKGKWGL